MRSLLFNIYRILVPKPVRTVLLKKLLRNRILTHFSSIPDEEINAEQKEVLEYLSNNDLRIFPCEFLEKYTPDDIEVFYDKENGMRYVIHGGKRLYFKKRWKEKRIKSSYCDLMHDQDINSPHRYLADSFIVAENDVVADIGAAEGTFSLSLIDKAKKLYVFEYDKEWVKALKATFAPWPDKVEIISKYVSERNDDSHVRIDTFFEEKKDINFLKVDVDGDESRILDSCKNIFRSGRPMKIALCTYHKNNDEKDFTSLLKGYGFEVTTSKGYMINYYDKKIKAPYLRRGLIRAIR